MYDREPLNKWVNDNIALVGDAAHPMLQYLAQGGGQALEDAAAMKDELAKSPIKEAFVNYETKRLSKGNLVQKNARLWGEFLHLEDAIPLKLRQLVFDNHHPNNYKFTDYLYKTE